MPESLIIVTSIDTHGSYRNCSGLYTYLGTRISSTGNFTSALDLLKEKAMHALYVVRRHTDLSRLTQNLALKVFGTMISPILIYNSEARGLYAKQNFKTWDSSPKEKVQLHFCKRYLETNNKASNLACRAELGLFPLIINIDKHILNYILYLKNKHDE